MIVADIFGLTHELIQLCSELGSHVKIVDPYQGVMNLFEDEETAYQFFNDHVGLDKYTSILFDAINQYEDEVVLVGFSVGASAIWRCSAKVNQSKVKLAYCFYGSQIRHHIDIIPTFPVNMILAKYEEHFSVKAMFDTLRKIEMVNAQRSLGLHGFMNKLSQNFSQPEYDNFILLLNQHVI